MDTRYPEVSLRSGAVVLAVVCLGFEGPGGLVPLRCSVRTELAWAVPCFGVGTWKGKGEPTLNVGVRN